MNYREQLHTFGSHGGLVGVLTEPAGEAATLAGDKPAIIVSNVGLNHRTGPNRLWVDLARRMAGKGFVTLRFDMDGLGDSSIRTDKRPDVERHAVDLREAVDFVAKKTKVARVALIGLCSGVDPVHAIATDDPRVCAAFFLDGYNYSTPRHLLNVRFLRAFDLRHYLRSARSLLLRRNARRETGFTDPVFVRDYPAPRSMRADIDAMLARGTRLYFGFTGGFAYLYSYHDQLFDMLPGGRELRDRIVVEMFPQADHLFSGLDLKEGLYASIERFLAEAPAQRG